jgi:indolepyruvate ferredoxin oxidoreductase beta subunit
LDADALASQAGNPRTENIVLLGAAASLEGFPLSSEPLKESVKRIVPSRAVEANIKAFDLGYAAIT